MLTLTLTDTHGEWDPKADKFVYRQPVTIHMEHSLVSLSKWEEKWKKAFLDPTDTNRTQAEILDYFVCMVLDEDFDIRAFKMLTEENIKTISDYIQEYHGATKIKQDEKEHGKHGNTRGVITTSESIYATMLEIGMEKSYETWNLSRLMKLIEVYMNRQKPKKKQTKMETAAQYAALNAKRRKQFGM